MYYCLEILIFAIIGWYVLVGLTFSTEQLSTCRLVLVVLLYLISFLSALMLLLFLALEPVNLSLHDNKLWTFAVDLNLL